MARPRPTRVRLAVVLDGSRVEFTVVCRDADLGDPPRMRRITFAQLQARCRATRGAAGTLEQLPGGGFRWHPPAAAGTED